MATRGPHTERWWGNRGKALRAGKTQSFRRGGQTKRKKKGAEASGPFREEKKKKRGYSEGLILKDK